MSDGYLSMSEFTACDRFGHSWKKIAPAVLECHHCGDEWQGNSAQHVLSQIPQEAWVSHPWLGRLKSGSDLEVDGSWFFTSEDAPAPLASLDRIVLQLRHGDGPWEDLARSDETFSPGTLPSAAIGWIEPQGDSQGPREPRSYRALIPTLWDPAAVRPEAASPLVDYFTDWRTRTWECACGFAGSNETALVFASHDFVSISCPWCAVGLRHVNRGVTVEDIAAAAERGHPEALALMDPDEYGSPFPVGRGVQRFLTSHETEVWFRDGDQFFGVEESWLVPRLRLDPGVGSVDLLECPLAVALDNEALEDLDLYDLLGPGVGELCTYSNGGIIGGRYDLCGGWLEDWAAEVRHSVTWIGDGGEVARAMALSNIAEGMGDWVPGEGEAFEVTSPYLDADHPDDVRDVVSLAGDAMVVRLNGKELSRS